MARLWWVLLPVVLVSGRGRAQKVRDDGAGWLVRKVEVANGSLLPDSPGFVTASAAGQSTGAGKSAPAGQTLPPCVNPQAGSVNPEAVSAQQAARCHPVKRYALFVNTPVATPMTVRQKGLLAVHDVIDPFNLLTIGADAAFTVGFNAHSAYGPGLKGFGRDVGYSMVQDATGEFIGTFGVCSLLHEDPRYHRMPNGTPRQRLVHALARTVIAQHDNGSRMPNYENFITYPASAEISNLYVPGVHGDGPSTVERFLTGLATDPVNNIITEFLPDFARRVHIRVVFVQQILNQIASGSSI